MELTITSEQKVTVTANPVTAAGNPAPIDGALVVTVVSGDATVVQDPATPLSFTLVSGVAGDSVCAVNGDADPGTGVQNLSDTVTLHVVNPFAASFGLTAGAPEPK